MTTRKSVAFALGFACLTTVAARTASAQTITFDENGKGTIVRGGAILPLISLGNQPDPLEPTLKPLTYDLTASGATSPVVRGDVRIFDVTATAAELSDVLRFLPDGRLLVYSDLPEAGEVTALADVGFPTTRQDNTINRPESGPEAGPNGLFGYIPTPNEPGFFANAAGGGPTYNFLSDAATPEPHSAALLAIGGCAALARRRRRRHAAQV
jgi:hypothetical protein